MNQMIEIDLRELMYALLRKIWLVILCMVLCGAAAFAYTKYCVTPLYRADVSFYVNNSSFQSDNNQSISSSDLATSQRLVLTYVNIIKSDLVLEKVVAESGLNITAPELRSIMTASSMDNTELFEVYISSPDPVQAAQIANALAAVAPGEISNILVGSATKVIDYAKVPTSPYTPNRSQNTMIGVLLGAFLAAAVIVVQAPLDVRIKGEDDLKKLSSVPVIGVIPDFATDAEEIYASKRKRSKQ